MRSAPTLAAAAFFAFAPLAGAQADLCVDGPDDITITHAFGDPFPELSYTVINCGDATGLMWSAQALGAISSFVSLDPADGTVTDVNGTTTVNAVFDLAAAPVGAQQVGAVRFFQGLVSKASKVIRFTLLKTDFEVGDTLIGDLAADDREVGAGEGLQGMKVKLNFKPDDPSLKARITIAEADGTVIKSFKTKKGKKAKKKVTIPSTGEFAVIVENLKGTGTYSVTTTRKKLPNVAKPRIVSKLKAPEGESSIEVNVGAFPGAILNANVVEDGDTDIGTLSVTLLDPGGGTVNTNAYSSTSDVAFHLQMVPLPDFGIYKIRVSGMSATDTVDVQITPFQPDQGSGTVDLDA